ncbi:MAG: Mth938-like domain-containing protein [Gammaproteobacteria bacterium]|nr:Mth938-like domain-containing protein [Gammaproteobacteria bacterium]
MKFTQDSGPAGYIIRAYAPGCIIVAYPPARAAENVVALPPSDAERSVLLEEQLTASFVIAPQHLLRDWPPQEFDELNEEHLRLIAALDPEVVLLGTGPKIRFPNQAWLRAFHQHGVGVEIMDNGAACRTYNILMTEGRNVVAGFISG